MYYFLEPCANSISSPVPEAAFSAECFSDIPASVLSRLNLTAVKSYCNGNETESCRTSQSGMTCEHSTESRGEDLLTLCVEDSPAKTLVAQEKAQESTVSEADYGPKWQGSLAKYDPITHSLKTRQTLLFEDSTESLVILPHWGMMQSGDCLEDATLVLPMKESVCGYTLPTPTATDSKRTPIKASYANRNTTAGAPDDLAKWAMRQSGLSHGRLVSDLWEWAMGWPRNWTGLKPVETDKFQAWLLSHGAL